MSIIAREPESTYTPAPEGLYQAVCVDVIDRGLMQTTWGQKHKVYLVWQLDLERDETAGTRYDIRKSYTLSLSEKATLRRDLETWRGKKFSKDELLGFDLEKLIDANCQLQIMHALSEDGKTYANVQAVVPYNTKIGPKMRPHKYVRVKDRGLSSDMPEGDDEGVPF